MVLLALGTGLLQLALALAIVGLAFDGEGLAAQELAIAVAGKQPVHELDRELSLFVLVDVVGGEDGQLRHLDAHERRGRGPAGEIVAMVDGREQQLGAVLVQIRRLGLRFLIRSVGLRGFFLLVVRVLLGGADALDDQEAKAVVRQPFKHGTNADEIRRTQAEVTDGLAWIVTAAGDEAAEEVAVGDREWELRDQVAQVGAVKRELMAEDALQHLDLRPRQPGDPLRQFLSFALKERLRGQRAVGEGIGKCGCRVVDRTATAFRMGDELAVGRQVAHDIEVAAQAVTVAGLGGRPQQDSPGTDRVQCRNPRTVQTQARGQLPDAPLLRRQRLVAGSIGREQADRIRRSVSVVHRLPPAGNVRVPP